MFSIIEVDPRGAQVLETLGTKRKFWFNGEDGKRMLFKAEERGTGEDWAEKVSSELADHLGIPHVHYELAREVLTGMPGVICATMIDPGAALAHGNQLLLALDGSYPTNRRFRVSEYTIETVQLVIDQLNPVPAEWMDTVLDGVQTAMDFFVGYAMLDALVANQDRHHENWAAVFNEGSLSLAPSFDHGASLARNLSEEERHERLLTKDMQRQIPAFARKARSAFYSGANPGSSLSTLAAYRAFGGYSPTATMAWQNRLGVLEERHMRLILDQIPPERMSPVTKDFTLYLLMENRARILNLEME